MKTNKKWFFINLIIICIYSCSVKKPTYYSQNTTRKSIVIVNDSILRYNEFRGCFGNSNTISYTQKDSLLKTAKKTDISKKGFFSLATDLYDSEVKINLDSIVLLKTGEVFYEAKYLESNNKREKLKFYIILDGKKKKITKYNANRVLQKIDYKKYTVIGMDKDIANKKYGIDKKYITIEYVLKQF